MLYKPLGEKHGIDLGSPTALKRGVMHLYNIDFALEWPRPLPPNVKLIGPLMPEPPKPLPADLQVRPHATLNAPGTLANESACSPCKCMLIDKYQQ